MNELVRQSDWEQKLKAGLGEAPAPDFSTWKAANAERLSTPVIETTRSSPAPRFRIALVWKTAAAAVLVACGWYVFLNPNVDGRAFAAAIPGVDDPKTITWTTTYFTRVTSADGQRTWIVPERRLNAYRSPGQYRQTRLDEQGEPYAVEITDLRAGRSLLVDLKAKRATLSTPKQPLDLRGPFAWVGEALRDRVVAKSLPVKSIAIRGKREVDKRQATVVRAIIDEGGTTKHMAREFLFDETSKGLVGIWLPNERDFDYRTAPDLGKPAEEKWSTSQALGYLEHEIVVDAKLDLSNFSLDAPSGYALEKVAPATVTEEEMIAYLGAAAHFHDGVFPDSPFEAFDSAKFNAVSQKASTERTQAEQRMIEQHDKFLLREIYRSPVRQFVDDHVAKDSFHYVGAEVRVDGPPQIVCWFTLKGSNQPRGLFSDLTVRALSPSEVPLDVSK